jgi:hypothetical protein
MLAWLKENYAIDEQAIDDLLIGYSDNEPGTFRVLKADPFNFTEKELLASGAFFPKEGGGGFALFDKRITFPFWSRGSVVFMIGRKTPLTPNNKFESGKYKKQTVHNAETRKYVARGIDNSVLYNEDCLISKPKRVVITEGVTDCIALMQRGIPTISPVTVRIKNDDWQRILPKLKGVETVYICQDNELSLVGLKGAMDTAATLSESHIDTRLVVLPLGQKQIDARTNLSGNFGITPESIDRLKDIQATLSEEEIKRIDGLIADSKIDVNEFFLQGATREAFEKLLEEAQTPMEFAIDSLPVDASPNELDAAVSSLLIQLTDRTPLEQERLLKSLAARLKKTVTLTSLREQLRKLNSKRKESQKSTNPSRRDAIMAMAPSPDDNTCLASVRRALITSYLEKRREDYAQAAIAAFEWFERSGAMFFYTNDKSPLMYFKNQTFWMESGDERRKRNFKNLIWEHAQISSSDSSGHKFFDVLARQASLKGQPCGEFSWIHTDKQKMTIYFNLVNEKNELVKITPDGIELVSNGCNSEKVFLADSRKIQPIHFIPDVNLEEANRLVTDLLLKNFTCEPGQAMLIYAWLASFLLLDFCGTKPLTRFEGPAGSGKTAASKMVSTLIYGSAQQKIATIAANYCDGAQNPFLFLDNVEARQMNDDLIAFLLTASTEISREIRKAGTDNDTLVRQMSCLISTSGIEPFCGGLNEALSRTLIFTFDRTRQTSNSFIESKVMEEIKANRDLILSAIFIRTSRVLRLIRDHNAQAKVMELIQGSIKDHQKRRCNEYLALMFLMLNVDGPEDSLNIPEQLDPAFISALDSLGLISRESARSTSPIAQVLHSLFNAYRIAEDLDRKAWTSGGDRSNHVVSFIEKYQVRFSSPQELEPMHAAALLTTLKTFAANHRLEFPYKDAGQLGKRIQNDIATLEDCGISITFTQNTRNKTKAYAIQQTFMQ